MKNRQNQFDEDFIEIDNNYEKQAILFQEEFEERMNENNSDEDSYLNELKHVQEMAFKGKLNPMHKQILVEWRELHPERFNNFCIQLNEENRQKLYHFLHLTHDES